MLAKSEPTPEMMMAYNALKTRSFRDESNTPTVVNNSGGPAYELDDWGRLRRFLVLGTEGGSYYVGQDTLTEQNARVVIKLAQTEPIRVVDEIVTTSVNGLAPKNDQALYALAIVASRADVAGRQYALKALPKVARTATHLFQFIEFAEQFRGWGRSLKRAVANWYLSKSPEKLAYQLVKYRQRNGWTHRDVLRLAKPVPTSVEHGDLLAFATGKYVRDPSKILSRQVEAFNAAQDGWSASEVLSEYGSIPWEIFPTERHNEPGFWRSLVKADAIPYIATMRNLSRWSRLGVLDASTRKLVLAKLTDPEEIRRSRVHPINILNAQRTYASGRSDRGTSTWTPIRPITDALDEAFYLSFKNVEPTNQRVLLALDVSYSMTSQIAGMAISAREGSAAMALATLASEKDADVVGFTSSGGHWGDTGITPIDLSPRRRLDDNIRTIGNLNFGATDIALPFNWAAENRKSYDLVCVYTDNETNYSRENPANALRRYRRKMNLNTKLVVVGMTSTPFTVADPKDPGMMDVAGFDSSAPQVISNFARGLI